MNSRAYLAELLGTFLFFAIGMSSVQAVGALGAGAAPLLVVVPLGFGLGLLAAIFAFGHVSGGHFNPAVTVAMAIDERLSPMDAAGYIVSQIIGAIGASALILVLWSQEAVKATITAPGSGFGDVQALVFETVLTAIFVLVILASTKHAPALAALAIPLTLVAIHVVGRAVHRVIGQSGAQHRPGPARRRPLEALDLPRRPDPRRGHRRGHLSRDGADAGAAASAG